MPKSLHQIHLTKIVRIVSDKGQMILWLLGSIQFLKEDWDVHFISTWQRFLFLLVSGIYKNKQTINQMKKEYSFRKHFAPSSAIPAQPGCTVCRHSAFLDDKKHIPFHHNRPYLLKQSVQACRKNLPQNGTCSIYSIALKVFVWMYVHMVIWVRG